MALAAESSQLAARTIQGDSINATNIWDILVCYRWWLWWYSFRTWFDVEIKMICHTDLLKHSHVKVFIVFVFFSPVSLLWVIFVLERTVLVHVISWHVTGRGTRWLATVWKSLGEVAARILPACQFLWASWEDQWPGQVGGYTSQYFLLFLFLLNPHFRQMCCCSLHTFNDFHAVRLSYSACFIDVLKQFILLLTSCSL